VNTAGTSIGKVPTVAAVIKIHQNQWLGSFVYFLGIPLGRLIVPTLRPMAGRIIHTFIHQSGESLPKIPVRNI
jgi:hypothetical protein